MVPRHLPVGGQCGEGEHWDPHWGQLYEGDQLAAHPTKEPLIGQVPAGIHRGTGDQKKQVPQGQAGDEQVGDISHGLDSTEDLDEGDIADEADEDDESIDGDDGIGDPRVEEVLCWVVGTVVEAGGGQREVLSF